MIQEDFEQHVVKLQNALLGFAKSLTHNEDEAKDLLQETSLKALSNKAMYDDSGSIKSWLYTIMRNLFLNCRRHSSRQESLPTDFEIPDTDDMQGGIEGEDSFSTIDVQRIMDLLSIDNRILFGLYLQGYRYDEIADRLQIPTFVGISCRFGAIISISPGEVGVEAEGRNDISRKKYVQVTFSGFSDIVVSYVGHTVFVH